MDLSEELERELKTDPLTFEQVTNPIDEFVIGLEEKNMFLMITLKAHLHIEETMNEILDKASKGKAFGDFNFYQKLVLLRNLGFINDECFSVTEYINRIRNKYSHNINFQINDDRLMALYHKFNDRTKVYIDDEIESLDSEQNYLFEKFKILLSYAFVRIHLLNVSFYTRYETISRVILQDTEESE